MIEDIASMAVSAQILRNDTRNNAAEESACNTQMALEARTVRFGGETYRTLPRRINARLRAPERPRRRCGSRAHALVQKLEPRTALGVRVEPARASPPW